MDTIHKFYPAILLTGGLNAAFGVTYEYGISDFKLGKVKENASSTQSSTRKKLDKLSHLKAFFFKLYRHRNWLNI